ncbi:hypothetical protein GIB67_022846 [Kingdonia uniflora]|uniref:Uncharacterized protein n=1 Tax=Kingdonia uniflora TaxID=39325 RepID=A0A7J7P6U7_9MAGN|nr:hypothetical protein GIB67_022846 [Kingdonia uniflora]
MEPYYGYSLPVPSSDKGGGKRIKIHGIKYLEENNYCNTEQFSVLGEIPPVKLSLKSKKCLPANSYEYEELVLSIANEGDVIASLTRELAHIKGYYCKISRWSIKYDPWRESSIKSMWRQMLGFKKCFFNEGLIKPMVNLIGGKYLILDSN